jgi:hypothetical protein
MAASASTPVDSQQHKIDIDPFLNRTTTDPETGCTLWTGATTPPGYAELRWGGKVAYAHRVAYERQYGPIPTTPPPDGSARYELHHTCSRRRCVNPEHIKLLPQKEHLSLHARLRAEAKKRLMEAAACREAAADVLLGRLRECGVTLLQ